VIPPPGEALPEPEIYVRLAEACALVPEPPAELFELAKRGTQPEGAAALFQAASAAAGGDQAKLLFWAYRTLGRELPAPALVAVWVQCLTNGFMRRDGVLRTLGEAWAKAGPFELGMELFRRALAHPEGVEMAQAPVGEANLLAHIGHEDKKIRLAPEPMLEEIERAAAATPARDPAYPFVLANGLRTRWTANTIQRDPAWRKGRGPHCALNLSPADARALGVADGAALRVVTRRGSVTLPAQVDARLQDGHVWMPNGFGMEYPDQGRVDGANQNELTDSADRDPFTGIPHHRHVACRLERAAGG
jgi:anaerobic selenocysteine-containing dehydrogenase